MSCNYHRSYVYESVKMLYIPELDAVCEWFERNIEENNRPKLLHGDELSERGKEISDLYFSTPFSDMQNKDATECGLLCEKIAKVLKKF